MTALEAALTTLRAKWGQASIQRGVKPQYHAYLSTGTPELDDLLGGGWTLGEAHSLIGYGSSGATTLAYRTLAAAQAEHLWPLWVDLPHTFDPLVAATLDVDVEQLVLVRPASIEETLMLLRDVLPLGGPVIVNVGVGELATQPEAARRLRRSIAAPGFLLWLIPLVQAHPPPLPTSLRVTCQRDPSHHPPPTAWQSTITVQQHDHLLGSVSLRFEL